MSMRGAEFRKSDFQIHSPRDAGWDGERPDESSKDTAEGQAARKSWQSTFLRSCVEGGLRAIAITDHHEGEYVYGTIEVAQTEQLDIWVFPGMELTCKDACQALILFDANLPKILFEKARGKLGLPANTSPESPRGIQVELLAANIADLQDLLSSDEELRGRFIVLPHVKPGGHKTVLRKGFHQRFREMPYVGGYMDAAYPDDLNPGDRKILDGEIPAWTSERRGVISTSDARHADFRLIGQHATWIKLAEPTAESIRQAMLAPDSRIRYQEPRLPKTVIRSVSIRGSTYLQDTQLEFNQQLNVVIGGRGAGKSSLLEYIRFALGCSALDIANRDYSSERMATMLEATLNNADGAVTVELLLNGAPVALTRQMRTRSTIQMKVGSEARSVSPDELRRLIPVQTFRQGELSDLGADEAESRLIELVLADSRVQLNKLEGDLRKIFEKFSEVLGRKLRLSAEEARAQLLQTELNVTSVQIESLQSQLQSEDPAVTEILRDHDKYEIEAARSENLKTQVRYAIQNIDRALADARELVENALPREALIASPELVALYDGVRGLFGLSDGEPDAAGEPVDKSEFDKAANSFMLQVSSIAISIDELSKPWEEKVDAHRQTYTTYASNLIGQEERLKEIASLTEKLQQTSTDAEHALQQVSALRGAAQELALLRQQKEEIERSISDEALLQAQRVESASAGFAKGRIADKPALDDAEATLRSILDLPHMREQRIEGAIDAIRTSQDPKEKWQTIVNELLAILEWKVGSAKAKESRPATPILHQLLDDAFLERLTGQLSEEDVLTAMKVSIGPRIEILHTRQGSEIEFKKASQGEQAATLLNILMNQSFGPLLIDQPEEDLDNRIINDVIKTIRKTKNERQLILATHNANITVNGDAELVLELTNGAVTAAGAIDEPSSRNAITETMEGGRDAFELRRKKYNF